MRAFLVIWFTLVNTAALAQTPAVDKVDFMGDMLAVTAFCNFLNAIDQYQLGQGMKALGVTSADRPRMEAARDRHYDEYRQTFKTATQHQEFCSSVHMHPFLIKVLRKGYPTIAGSDQDRQPEKIEFFGEFLGTVLFCRITLNEDKWGKYLFDMGVKIESVKDIGNKAMKQRDALKAQYGDPFAAAAVCQQVRANPAIDRFAR